MALIVGGTTVTGTQTLDATKLTGNLPSISGASLTNIPAAAPSAADVVGAHALGLQNGYSGGFQSGAGGTTSSFRFCNVHGNHTSGSAASGTWRRHGTHSSGNDNERTTVYCRIS